MMKKLPAFVLTAAVLAMVLAACAPQGAAPSWAPGETALPGAPAAAYRLEKLNQVCDMVLEREGVPADYLRYLPDDIKALVEDYNEQTASLRTCYTDDAARIAATLLYEHKSDPGNYEQSPLYYEWIERIAHYALYENAEELCRNDPCLAYPLMVEAGGSYSLWPHFLHDHEEERQQQLQDYFSLVDQLLNSMDAAREITGED